MTLNPDQLQFEFVGASRSERVHDRNFGLVIRSAVLVQQGKFLEVSLAVIPALPDTDRRKIIETLEDAAEQLLLSVLEDIGELSEGYDVTSLRADSEEISGDGEDVLEIRVTARFY